MVVFIVGVLDADSNIIKHVCATKEIAERELFKIRDELVEQWKKDDIRVQNEIKEFCLKENKKVWIDNMYVDMVTALLGNDHKNWGNHLHGRPYIQEVAVLAE